MRRKIALAGVVCSSLTQLGDCNLVLNLLGPSIQQELVSLGTWVPVMLCARCHTLPSCYDPQLWIGELNILTIKGWIHYHVLLQVKFPPFGSVHSFLCAVAALSSDKRSDSSDLPEALQNITPQCVAEFLIALFKVKL
jgi:hypothetical protein